MKMNEQERKIIKLLLNEMAFEGAATHFGELPPDVPAALYAAIERIEIPQRYDGNTESYRYVEIEFRPGTSVYEKCYAYLRIIRNNIVHANKAYRPDTPQRLTELLDWAETFIDTVNATGSPFARRAREIKQTMKIESF
jgi:hypothetical protein